MKIKKTDTVVSSIAGSKVSIKPMTTLEMEESELVDTLNFEAKKHVPLDGSDPVVDYHILGQNPKEIDKIDMILVATTQKIIKAHNSIVKGCGLKNSIFDADPLALLNCYNYNYESLENNVDVSYQLCFPDWVGEAHKWEKFPFIQENVLLCMQLGYDSKKMDNEREKKPTIEKVIKWI